MQFSLRGKNRKQNPNVQTVIQINTGTKYIKKEIERIYNLI